MASITRDFEGQTAGTAMTAGNTAASQVTTNAGTAVFATNVVRNGVMGGRVVSAANALDILRFATPATVNTQAFGFFFSVDATPTNSTWFFGPRYSGGWAMRLYWTPTNTITTADTTGGNTLTIATGVTPGAIYYVSLNATVATSTTGTFTVKIYDSSNTLVGSQTSSAYNLGTTALNACDIGVINTNPTAGTAVNFDYLRMVDSSTAEITPPSTSYNGTAALTGSGTLTAAGKPALSGTVSLAGAGTLTSAVVPSFAATANLSGTAVLNASGSPSVTAGVGLTSNGVLTVIGNAGATGIANLNGNAALAATGLPSFTGRTDFSSTGSLAVSGKPSLAGNVAFTSGATLDTATSSSITGQAAFTGTSTLTAVEAQPQRDITVTATLGSRRWSGHTSERDKHGSIDTRRWGGSL